MGDRLAQKWETAVTSAFLRISQWPKTGSLCNFRSPELRGTRRISIRGFPKHLVFYQPFADGILVLRVVYGARDLESLFSN